NAKLTYNINFFFIFIFRIVFKIKRAALCNYTKVIFEFILCHAATVIRNYELSRTFILGGVGYDIFPMSWERLEDIAALHSNMQPLVCDAEIIYCGDKDALARFTALQESVKRNLSDNTYVRCIAKEKLNSAAQKLAAAQQSSSPACKLKYTAWALTLLADAMMVTQNDYFRQGMKKQFEDISARCPEWFSQGYREVIEFAKAEDAVERAYSLLERVCEYRGIEIAPPEHQTESCTESTGINAAVLAEFYQEICSTFNKIYVCCESGNYILAFFSAGILQLDLDEVREFGSPAFALLEKFDYRNLAEFADAAHRIEDEFVAFILANGGRITSYDGFEEFESN
ncbi:MAG: hypothetical protein IKV47_00080, partial [Oscillospiraceae bacterium]|nr:hypothetical protein [Oscillospiraceae bacterium]